VLLRFRCSFMSLKRSRREVREISLARPTH
jgi:hypothetical protein